jgi:hypothetical protein
LLGLQNQSKIAMSLLVTDKQENGYCRGYYYSPNNTKTKDYALGANLLVLVLKKLGTCVYVAIGQKRSSVANLAKLTEANAMNWTTIVAASDPAITF